MEDEPTTAVLVFFFQNFLQRQHIFVVLGLPKSRVVVFVWYYTDFATDSSVLHSRGESFVILFTFSIAQLIRRLRCDESLQQAMEKSNCCYALDFSCHRYLWTVFEHLITIVNNFKGKLFRFLLWLIVAKQLSVYYVCKYSEAHRMIASIDPFFLYLLSPSPNC